MSEAGSSLGLSLDVDVDALHAQIAAVRAKRVLFIGGAPKSGTTWLQLLFDAHPAISCHGEGHYPNHFLGELRRAVMAHNELMAFKGRAILDRFSRQMHLDDAHLLYLFASAVAFSLARPPKAQDAVVLGEKTPDNLLYFPLLQAVFPQARFVHVVRDGRDGAVSAWFHRRRSDLALGGSGEIGDMGAFVASIGQLWARLVGMGHQFAQGNPETCREVRYEDLAVAPEATLAPLLEWLGVSDAPDVVARCCAAASFATLSGGRQPGEENAGSFFRQGRPGNWREHFTPEVEAEFHAAAGPWLAQYGYLGEKAV